MKLTNCQNKVVIDPKKKMLIGNPNTVKIKNMIIKKICYWVSDQKTKKYQKSIQQNNKTERDSSILQKKQSAVDFFRRLEKYAFMLSKKQKNQYSIQLIQSTQDYFIEAGTTIQQISDSVANITNKLWEMHNQSQILFKKYELNDKQKLQKYQRRYQQFISLMKQLSQKNFKQISFTQVQSIQIALYFLNLETKMTSLVDLLYGATQLTNPYFKFTPDIINDDPFSKKYKYAWQKTKLIQLDPSTKAKHDQVYRLLKNSVIMVTNAVVNEHKWSKWDNLYWKKIIFGLSFPISLYNLQKAELACYKIWRNPNIQMVKNLLDLPQSGYLQHAKKFIYPSIKQNFFLYIPSSDKAVNQVKNEISVQKTDVNIFQKAQNSGRILLLSHQDLHFKKSKPVQKLQFINKLINLNQYENQIIPNNLKKKQTIIIHMHGGGFISMSSQLMQNHTRKWANQLQIPVFSLDYRKPPNHRFPEPLQDCVAGYKFIVQKIHQYLNIQPKNIILAGDSAGGNIACALQAYLLKQKYPILPKALFLMYPAVDLRARYTASRLHSFQDGIFLPSLLLLCQSEYLGKQKSNQFNPLASPILLTQSYINPQKSGSQQGKKWPQDWPKTVIMAGRKDPLFDDSIRLLERLTRDNIKCKLLLYKDFSHGFMSMDQVLPGCKRAIDESIIQLKQIIKDL